MSTTALQSQIIQKAWQDPSFKSKLITDPKAAIQEFFGITLPESINVKTVEENENEFFIVLPPNPSKAIKAELTPQVAWN